MEVRYPSDPEHFERMNTEEIRKNFLVDNMFVANEVTSVYSLVDRAIIGSAIPVEKALPLKAGEETATDYFTERREIGIINIGAEGIIKINDKRHQMDHKDMLYVGKGNNTIEFSSVDSVNPAKFYFVSYPAHAEYPTVKVAKKDTEVIELGDAQHSSKRTIYKYIYPEAVKTCQLVMGINELGPNSTWNTMPGHTHFRRSEIYMYCELGDNEILFHFMGKPEQTRHIVVREGQAVISPGWSIHAGAGTKNYTFVWAMGGENQTFTDMQTFGMDTIM